MKCVICKTGTLRWGKTNFTVEKNGAFLVFSNVEAKVCDNCGEAYFDDDTTTKIQEKALQEFKKGNAVEVVKL